MLLLRFVKGLELTNGNLTFYKQRINTKELCTSKIYAVNLNIILLFSISQPILHLLLGELSYDRYYQLKV